MTSPHWCSLRCFGWSNFGRFRVNGAPSESTLYFYTATSDSSDFLVHVWYGNPAIGELWFIMFYPGVLYAQDGFDSGNFFWISIFRSLCPTPPLYINRAAIGTHSNSIEDCRNMKLYNMHTHFLVISQVPMLQHPLASNTSMGKRWKTAASLSPASCAPLTVLTLFTPGAVPPKPRYFGTCLSNAGGMEGLGVWTVDAGVVALKSTALLG